MLLTIGSDVSCPRGPTQTAKKEKVHFNISTRSRDKCIVISLTKGRTYGRSVYLCKRIGGTGFKICKGPELLLSLGLMGYFFIL